MCYPEAVLHLGPRQQGGAELFVGTPGELPSKFRFLGIHYFIWFIRIYRTRNTTSFLTILKDVNFSSIRQDILFAYALIINNGKGIYHIRDYEMRYRAWSRCTSSWRPPGKTWPDRVRTAINWQASRPKFQIIMYVYTCTLIFHNF